MMRVHRGVIVPAGLTGRAALDAYADAVKAGNTAFLHSVLAVERGDADATIARWDYREVGQDA